MIIGLKISSSDFELSSFDMKVINGVVKRCAENCYRVLLDTMYENKDSSLYSRDPVIWNYLIRSRK